MPLPYDEDWKKQRHEMLDEHIVQFYKDAHRLLDKIMESDVIADESFIGQKESLIVLPNTVMFLLTKDSKYGPKSNQKEWKSDIERVKKVL